MSRWEGHGSSQHGGGEVSRIKGGPGMRRGETCEDKRGREPRFRRCGGAA